MQRFTLYIFIGNQLRNDDDDDLIDCSVAWKIEKKSDFVFEKNYFIIKKEKLL